MNLVDQKDCKMILCAWRFEKKRYVIIKNGTHDQSTEIHANSIMNESIWFISEMIQEIS